MAKKKAKARVKDDFTAPWADSEGTQKYQKIVTGKKSTWVDDGVAFKEDTEFAKKVTVRPPVEKGVRPVVKKVKAKCTRCNKNYTVSGELVTSLTPGEDYYICEKCITHRPLEE